MTVGYEHLEHTADLALRFYGRDRHELFAHAAHAMFSELADLEAGGASSERQVAVRGMDYESLLVNWLNELLYLHETEGEVYSVFEIVKLSPRRLRAVAKGWQTQSVQTIIKAATYHQLAIEKTADGYTATVVFDV